MKRTAVFILLAGLTSVWRSPRACAVEEYTVVHGDTLWDLSERFYRDPWQWKKIWKANMFVENPDLIEPGQKLSIPGPDSASEPVPETQPARGSRAEPDRADGTKELNLTPAQEPQEVVEDSPPAAAEASVDPVPEASTRSSSESLVPVDWGGDGIIVGDRDKKAFVSMGDLVYLDFGKNLNVEPGTLFTVYRLLHKVKHPKSNRVIGLAVKSIGKIKIVGGAEDRGVSAKVLWSSEPIQPGDKVRIQK